ncbi:MAG: class I SAM-dependent methyltransferase [Caldilineaceae bacterium]|nr:class I SAM-dependent methyltransferase [Caldilineaceae bacterium]
MSNHSTIKESVNRQFSRVAANYATSAVHAGGEDLARLVELAGLTGTEQVLDAGCGAGHTALALAPEAGEVTALDLSSEMLAQVAGLAATRGLDNISVQQGDVEQLPFADNRFDVVTSRYSAHHWPRPERALEEIRRVLTPGGRFLLADVVSFDDYTTDTFVQTVELLRDPSHVRDHTASQWLTMLRGAGFQAEIAFIWSLRLDFATWTERMATPSDQVAMLRRTLDFAPAEVQRTLQVEADHSFTFAGALFYATRSEML